MRRAVSPAPPRRATAASRKPTAAPCSSTSWRPCRSPAQDRLLRAVEYGEVTRIGASKPISVDVRIVAATNEHLPGLVDQGRFRADLLDRLSFEVVTLPPLRVAQRRHSLARRTFRPPHGGRARLAELAGLQRRGDGRARSLSLAGQRPRTEQRRRARRLSRRGSRAADRRRSSSTRSIRPGRRPRLAGARRARSGPPRSQPRARPPAPQRPRPRGERFPRAPSPNRAGDARGRACPKPLQPARDRGRARPQLRPAPPRDEAAQAAGFRGLNRLDRLSKRRLKPAAERRMMPSCKEEASMKAYSFPPLPHCWSAPRPPHASVIINVGGGYAESCYQARRSAGDDQLESLELATGPSAEEALIPGRGCAGPTSTAASCWMPRRSSRRQPGLRPRAGARPASPKPGSTRPSRRSAGNSRPPAASPRRSSCAPEAGDRLLCPRPGQRGRRQCQGRLCRPSAGPRLAPKWPMPADRAGAATRSGRARVRRRAQ